MTETAVILDVSFPAEPMSVPRCREMAAAQMREVTPKLDRDTVLLLISEVVTNALRHGSPPLTLRMLRPDDGAGLRVEVSDGLDQFALRPMASVLAPDGRGLMLVQAMASRWGWYKKDHGKVVWFELDSVAA